MKKIYRIIWIYEILHFYKFNGKKKQKNNNNYVICIFVDNRGLILFSMIHTTFLE